ncbi:uncharacterized protein SPPG_06573 [Spizellomyces punctatus DAOM BR117]|uniref:sphingomyelin phosphodiesterase n=1 Tax=Spizellomyces punctatus (strain DAOM BR117) TaxID=645134 RepID=A0A0L0HBQ9_SPIPD|nr:uncharacterized protein SPPG_06573 [Spizellomyces punctatus DAOM BR117]KNC98168.1 hypothetical protein SPPG_06573 [Spizellomyces punctatus DAOM BR117]|eukprot:XP_016606208.1 hypothetical protein SPPG_06573 [Spizellomyces punctatus DAOM BR117]
MDGNMDAVDAPLHQDEREPLLGRSEDVEDGHGGRADEGWFRRLRSNHSTKRVLGKLGLYLFGFLVVLLGLFALLARPLFARTPPLATPDTPPPSFPSTGIRMLAYNFYLRPPPIESIGRDYKEDRLNLFIETAINEFDIMALSETFGTFNSRRERLVDAAAERGLRYWAHGNERNWWKGTFVDSGLLVLSRFPIIKTETILYQGAYGPDRYAAKGVLYTQILLDDTPDRKTRLHLFTSHLQASYLPDDPDDGDDLTGPASSIRYDQFIQMRSFIDSVLEASAYDPVNDAVVLAGDFNVPGARFGGEPQRDGKEYLRMLQTLTSRDAEVLDALREATGQQPQTWKPWKQCLKGTEDDHKQAGKRLDYILQWRPRDAHHGHVSVSVNETGLRPFRVQDRPFNQLSDHTGVTSILRLAPSNT